jgi:thioredoxin reductase (NADPH)
MEVLLENIAAYLIVAIFLLLVFYFYIKNAKRSTETTQIKINKAVEMGFHEPVSLHPVVNHEICIGSGACIQACPEKDILGLINGQAHTVNASRCVGHGACFHACPVQAITLCIGTEKRGVELPHVSPEFESNIPGLFIAGELGGMGLIKNAVEQGKQAVGYLTRKLKKSPNAVYDLIIVGAGPAGIAASLAASKAKLNFITIEQDTLGGAVFSFPRAKIVMTQPMDLPLYGKIKLSETNKSELLGLWNEVISKNEIPIHEQEKVDSIEKIGDYFFIKTNKDSYTSNSVLLSIGRRGSPRKLGVPGEEKEKVYYRLLEPELIHNQKVLVIGGGDSAIESALLLLDEGNEVSISYRSDGFSRLKPKNLEKINAAISSDKVKIFFNSNVKEIYDDKVELIINKEVTTLANDLVFVFAGGELPTKFLEKTGIAITKKFGDAVMRHKP